MTTDTKEPVMDERLQDIEALRSSVRSLVLTHAPLARNRVVAETDDGHDAQVWDRLSTQVGVQGLVVPEPLGGSGAGRREVAVVYEELGAELVPGPFLGTTLATEVLLAAGGDGADGWLPGLASGARTAAVGLETGLLSVDERSRVSGCLGAVLDAGPADLLVVVARDRAGDDVLLALATNQPGVATTSVAAADTTRRFAQVVLDQADAVPLAIGRTVREVVALALPRAASALAAQELGSSRRNLHDVLDYAEVRHQFDRPIGSFQAVQHKLADAHVEVMRLTSVSSELASRVESDDVVPLSFVATVLEQAARTSRRVAQTSIQVHGGIGFTWEHSAHLFLRRSLVDTTLLIGPTRRFEIVRDSLLGTA